MVPATNFTSGFPKLGYLAIKSIFDRNNINYTNKTIIQASDLKSKLESLKLSNENCTIVSLDIVDMYPSITFLILMKAIEYFSRNFSEADKERIRNALEMWQFSMGNLLLTFQDKYYQGDHVHDACEP